MHFTSREYIEFLQNLVETDSELRHIRPRWWTGGAAGAIVNLLVAPIDLIETRMQALKHKMTMREVFRLAVQKQGFFSLYDGVSAALLRAMTYTTLRFYIYDRLKKSGDQQTFLNKAFIAALSGIMASIVGVPLDMVHTRMQVDRALPHSEQRRYRHVFDALYKIANQEGFPALYSGTLYVVTRAAIISVGQNAMYDEANLFFRQHLNLDERSTLLHLMSSVSAGLFCAPLVQPFDVLKTISMQMKYGYFKSWKDQLRFMLRFGITGLFRGLVPGTLRLVPSTVALFLCYEKLRLRFGYYDKKKRIQQ